MRRVTRSIDVRREAATAWGLVGDVSRYDEFVVGATRWDHLGGDRYAILLQVGAFPIGGEVEVTVDDVRRRVDWASLRGAHHTASLQVGATGETSCRVTFALAVDLAGPAAPVTEWLAAPMARRNLVASLETARHLLEHPPHAGAGGHVPGGRS